MMMTAVIKKVTVTTKMKMMMVITMRIVTINPGLTIHI